MLTRDKLKSGMVLFWSQILLYTILVVNYRAVAQAEYSMTVITDFAFASVNFVLIRRIAKSDTNLDWICYTVGSVFGSVSGIYVSKLLLPS